MKKILVQHGTRLGMMTEERYRELMKSRMELYNLALSKGWSEEKAQEFLPKIVTDEKLIRRFQKD